MRSYLLLPLLAAAPLAACAPPIHHPQTRSEPSPGEVVREVPRGAVRFRDFNGSDARFPEALVVDAGSGSEGEGAAEPRPE
ncbi:MAG TPA: hypothetical protein VGR37_16630 [Longimicrobiaceae bacterium]|nr:hypothetical protein [Longimicrobiaceae bacterium]